MILSTVFDFVQAFSESSLDVRKGSLYSEALGISCLNPEPQFLSLYLDDLG